MSVAFAVLSSCPVDCSKWLAFNKLTFGISGSYLHTEDGIRTITNQNFVERYGVSDFKSTVRVNYEYNVEFTITKQKFREFEWSRENPRFAVIVYPCHPKDDAIVFQGKTDESCVVEYTDERTGQDLFYGRDANGNLYYFTRDSNWNNNRKISVYLNASVYGGSYGPDNKWVKRLYPAKLTMSGGAIGNYQEVVDSPTIEREFKDIFSLRSDSGQEILIDEDNTLTEPCVIRAVNGLTEVAGIQKNRIRKKATFQWNFEVS